ncbi:hypothetical protein ILUMI_17763, partial [Ignelater luminosus]
NWEDTLDVSLCFLIRTILSKSEKDKIKAAHTSIEEITEISKVEKHINQVLERVIKIGPNLETHINGENEGKQIEEQNNKELLPIGSRIGESSSRILSARKGVQRKRQETVTVYDDTE